MVRKLKHHEQKLLRKVDFYTYRQSDPQHREHAIRRRYHLTHPLDYSKYNTLCGNLRSLAHKLAALDPADAYRVKMETAVLEKLWDMGVLKKGREQGGSLSSVEREVTVSAFARRRLGVIMVRMGMVELVSAVCVSSILLLRFAVIEDNGILIINSGAQIHRTRPRPCRNGRRHRSGVPRLTEYGGFRDLGRLK